MYKTKLTLLYFLLDDACKPFIIFIFHDITYLYLKEKNSLCIKNCNLQITIFLG